MQEDYEAFINELLQRCEQMKIPVVFPHGRNCQTNTVIEIQLWVPCRT
ncbi:hypothetical protein HJG54_07575 [Leptolyngbya sp. NK1-12]|uniref:Uncharacterized protein n=1 Tax=Leptolyngbya sp. NK1-12 TaxID=2547451 RepID=A0AA96WDT6_9CYAN|nr:hypothetical protein [Leptolyngbya sp. NK1-12]WNZ22730.1 hypothetical protein HJG54_07575 [Leptolyngbya sp. NK1-12]